MKGQDDLEMILETLHDHFKLIRLTSFEEMARNNTENKSAKQLLDLSNNELAQLLKTLDLLQMDEEDVRYDVFSMIYDMLFDNIHLRQKHNKLSTRIMTLAQSNLDKTVSNFFHAHNKTVSGAVALATAKFKTDIYNEMKNGGQKKSNLKGRRFTITPGNPNILPEDSFCSDNDSYGSNVNKSSKQDS